MAFKKAKDALRSYRTGKIAALEKGGALPWFTGAWDSLDALLAAFDTSEENKAIASLYAAGAYSERVPAHALLDYICRLRREIRKQYCASGSGVCTDVTPFRLSIEKTNGAALFDDAFDDVMSRKVVR